MSLIPAIVVIGSPRISEYTMESKGCNVEWHRQTIHLQQENLKTNKSGLHVVDTLPVVELKPFIKKVWRREKSLPAFHEKTSIKDTDVVSESPREKPPDIGTYIRTFNEQQKSVDSKSRLYPTHRYRSQLHPKADFNFDVAGHQQDLIPSFTTRFERTKTTVNGPQAEEVGAGPKKQSSSPIKNELEDSNMYARDKTMHQIFLKGGKLPLGSTSRHPLLYLSPLSRYHQKHPWKECRDENMPHCSTHPASMSMSQTSTLTLTANALGRQDLVLSGSTFTLGRQDLVFPGSTFQNKTRLQPLRLSQHSQHRFNSKLGAAKDSLLLLSQRGTPTALERNLSYGLELHLERCRREKNFSGSSDSSSLFNAHYVAYDSQPTQGEITLMRSREANKSVRGSKLAYRRNRVHKPIIIPGHNANLKLNRAPDNSSSKTLSDKMDSRVQSSTDETFDESSGQTFTVASTCTVSTLNGVARSPHDMGKSIAVTPVGDSDLHGMRENTLSERSAHSETLPGRKLISSRKLQSLEHRDKKDNVQFQGNEQFMSDATDQDQTERFLSHTTHPNQTEGFLSNVTDQGQSKKFPSNVTDQDQTEGFLSNVTDQDQTEEFLSNVTEQDQTEGFLSNVTDQDQTGEFSSNVTDQDQTGEFPSNVTDQNQTEEFPSNVTEQDQTGEFPSNVTDQNQTEEFPSNVTEQDQSDGFLSHATPQHQSSVVQTPEHDLAPDYSTNSMADVTRLEFSTEESVLISSITFLTTSHEDPTEFDNFAEAR